MNLLFVITDVRNCIGIYSVKTLDLLETCGD